MKKNFNSIIFIKIFIFTLLIWIIHYNNDLKSYNGLLDEKYKLDRDLYLTTNRQLAHHSVNRNFNGRFNKVLDEEHISKNKKDILLQNKELKESELKREKRHKVHKSSNSSLSSRADVFCEKKIFSVLHSIDKIKNNEEMNAWEKCTAINRKKIKALLIPSILLLLVLLVYYKLGLKLKGIIEVETIYYYPVTIIFLGFLFAIYLSIVLGFIYTCRKIKKYRTLNK
ncbi:hypothetical protein MKS88_001777 [Plasmodium brasilianum]|uniref:Fam-m protein n=2 Tax=Plasmodium (Plasmodium) TaxID=418103 RepID=A0A1D3JHH8_PLAMA|nr:Plasmodium exported protein, unknown function [Plasmodium malariae]KAI4839233.1 hypothetical protein MKS88_001777 [Plasmodium brasilianum]SBT85745.1 Plasmodium exported protein, unknown function [Plasmodium malariae]